MIALCPNGKKILFVTNDPNVVSNVVHCNCGQEVHNKKELIFNPTNKQLEEKKKKSTIVI